jgi:nitrogenase molybdenum-iron protein alpha/beta subunit
MGRALRDYLMDRFGAAFGPLPFPVGFHETVRWLESIAARFGREDRVDEIVSRHRDEYRNLVQHLRPTLAGRRVFILTLNHRIDWVLEPAHDIGLEVVKVAVLDHGQDDHFTSRYDVAVETGYPLDQRNDDIADLRPDIVLSNLALKDLPEGVRGDQIPVCPDVGFQGGLFWAGRWQRLLKAPVVEGWKHDARLFAD